MNSKIYRCGWCGGCTDKDGNYLKDEVRRKAEHIIDTYGDGHTQKVHGGCGGRGEYGNSGHDRVQVTKEMALDAGMPEIEGTWINW